MTLGLQSRIIRLSVLSVTLISVITFLLILYLYHIHSIRTIDKYLLADVNAVKQLLSFNDSGQLDLSPYNSRAVSSYAKYTNIYYLVSNEQLNPLRRSSSMNNIELPTTVIVEGYQYIKFADEEYRVYATKYLQTQHSGSVNLYIHVLRPMQPIHNEVEQLFYLLLFMLPLPILLTGIGSWWITKHTIQPINKLIKTVETINSESLNTQIPIARNDEVGKLTEAFNIFLYRLNNAFSALKQFTSDASHELRTPLTVMRTQSEVMLQKTRQPAEYQQNIVSSLEEITRLENLTDTLLQLTRADAGITKSNFEPMDISSIVKKWLENLSPLAEEKNIQLRTNITNDIIFNIDQSHFECIIINLLSNAIQYTPQHGKVIVSLTILKNNLQLKVEDSGPGIPAAERKAVFDRFKRLQQTRHVSTGSGLGLSVVQWAVRNHNGKIWVDDSSLGGCAFIVNFNTAERE